MKKSNIILISLFGLMLMAIVIVGLYLKSTIINNEENKIVLPVGSFTELKIESGWTINLRIGNEFKVAYTNDSIKDLIESEGNTLILKKNEQLSEERARIDVFCPKIKKLYMEGNSYLLFNNEYTDSLEIILKGKSKVDIRKNDFENNQSEFKRDRGVIKYVFASLEDKSAIMINNNIKLFTGQLKDSTHCTLTGRVNIESLSKSENSQFRMW